MTKTDWFPGEVKPVRKGEYQVRHVGHPNVHVRMWDGRRWRTTYGEISHFDTLAKTPGKGEWRGLTEAA